MRADRRERSLRAARAALPAVDHEAHGPLSLLVRLAMWLSARRRAPARGTH